MQPTTPTAASKLTLQGIHVDLTPALHTAMHDKFHPLLELEERIVRLNVRLHQDQKTGNGHHYTATGQIEIGGPDLIASAGDADAYVALDQLAQKLRQLLTRRHERRKDKRNHPHAVELDADIPKAT